MIQFFKDKFFQKELKREIRLLIIVTIGFSIAFAWRQTIFDAALSIIRSLFSLGPGVTSSTMASMLITLIGLLLVLLTSKYLKDEY